MKRIVLILIKDEKTYYTEVPELFKKHFIKKYEKQGFIVKPWDFNTKKLEEDNENHIPYIY